MNTYRVYLIDVANPEAPTVEMKFIQAPKYGIAWTASRAILAGKEEAKGSFLYDDAECKKASKFKSTDSLTVAKVLDCTPRNKKLDKATLADILADTSLNDGERLAKIKALSQ